MNIHDAHSYWTQGALGAQARRVRAGAGPQRAARTGAGHIVAASRLQLVRYILAVNNNKETMETQT